MTLAGKPHASRNSWHRPGGCSKEFLSSLDTKAGHIGVGRFACRRFEGSRKMIRAHMDARSKVLQRESARESCMDIVFNQLELPGTHPCLPVRNGERICAVFAKQLRNKHLSSRIEEEPSRPLRISQLISKRIHDGGDQRVMLSEAVDNLYPMLGRTRNSLLRTGEREPRQCRREWSQFRFRLLDPTGFR